MRNNKVTIVIKNEDPPAPGGTEGSEEVVENTHRESIPTTSILDAVAVDEVISNERAN